MRISLAVFLVLSKWVIRFKQDCDFTEQDQWEQIEGLYEWGKSAGSLDREPMDMRT